MEVLFALVARLKSELPYWRLSTAQCGGLALLAAWPWLMIHAAIPGADVLAFVPVIVFVPIAWLLGSTCVSLASDLGVNFPRGHCAYRRKKEVATA